MNVLDRLARTVTSASELLIVLSGAHQQHAIVRRAPDNALRRVWGVWSCDIYTVAPYTGSHSVLRRITLYLLTMEPSSCAKPIGGLVSAVAAAVARGTRPRVPLSHCTNLAPAGTGTTTVSKQWLQQLHIDGQSVGFAHHRHDFNLSFLHSLGARCFVITLREPNERLLSTFLYDLYMGHGQGGLYHSKIGVRSPRSFVDALSSPSHRGHEMIASVFQASTADLGERMVATDKAVADLANPHLRASDLGAVRVACRGLPENDTRRGIAIRGHFAPVAASLLSSFPTVSSAKARYDACLRWTRDSPNPKACFRHGSGEANAKLTASCGWGPSVAPAAEHERAGRRCSDDGVVNDQTTIDLCGGSFFLVPQASYLVGLDALEGVELHVLCTTHMGTSADDWAAFVARYGGVAPEHSGGEYANRTRRSSQLSYQQRQQQGNSALREDFFLDANRSRLLSECYYATDAALFARFCQKGRSSNT